MGDKAPKPDTDDSVTNPIETMTSGNNPASEDQDGKGEGLGGGRRPRGGRMQCDEDLLEM